MPPHTFKAEKDVPEGTWYLERLGEGEPMVIPLVDKRTVLGSKILLKNAKRVSSEHVILVKSTKRGSPKHAISQNPPEDDLFVLIDMGSKYGTYVNNKKLDLEGIVLKRNSAFTLGRKWPKNKRYYAFNLRYKERFSAPGSGEKYLASDGQSEDEPSGDDSDVNVPLLSENPPIPNVDSHKLSIVLKIKENALKRTTEPKKAVCIQPLPRKFRIPKLHDHTETDHSRSTVSRFTSSIPNVPTLALTVPAAVSSRRSSDAPCTTQTNKTSPDVCRRRERSQSFHGRYSGYSSNGKVKVWNKNKILKAYRHRLPMPGGGSDVRKC